MFHDSLTFFKTCLFSMTSISNSNASFVHMFVMLTIGFLFNYDASFLVFDSITMSTFSLFATCQSNMIFHCLGDTIKFHGCLIH
jgi:hypothetical protein